MGEPLLPRFDGERGDTERFDAPIFIAARRALRLLQGIARSSRDGAGETKIAQKAEGRLMKVPINFFALGVEGERVVGLFPEGEGGKGAAFGGAQGAFAHIIRGRGRKDVFCPLPPARGEVDVEVGAFGVRLPKGKIIAAVEGEQRFAAGRADAFDPPLHEKGAVGVHERDKPHAAEGNGALQMFEREERCYPLARVDRIDGDAERPSLPHAEGEEGAAIEASADDAFFSRVGAIGGADAAIDVHSALYAGRTGVVKRMSLEISVFGGKAEELSFMRDPDLYNPPASLRSAPSLTQGGLIG